jgi:predicted acetyltransferase
VDARPIVRRLLELNAYEFSAIDDRDMGPEGEYGYPYLDHYWDESSGREPLLFHVDDRLAGFALVRTGRPHQMAEFLVLPKYRPKGLGTHAARQILARWPGEWVTHELPGNDRAVAFWRRAIPVGFEETADADGTTQRFVIGAEGPSGSR